MEEKKKVWIRGRKGCGSEIVKILEQLGAQPTDGRCDEDDCIYFVDHENGIGVTFMDSELAQVIMDNYREIKIPRQEPGEAGKEQEEKAAAQQQLTERNEEKKPGIGKRSYYGFPNGVEAEDICRYLSFNLGNVVKYACRAGRKDAKKKIEDLQKARDYLDNEIKRLKEGEE